MKKIYHILILLILSLSGYSQVYQSMPQYGYGPVKRFWVDSTLSIPTVCGVPTLKANVTKHAAISFDSCNNRFYFYNPKTLAWDTIKGGGSAFDSTSLSNRINGKVDSVKRSADSVYYYKTGQKYLAFRDSIGGVQNGRWGNDTATIMLAKVRNATATTMARGTVVMLSGATGDVASVIRANNKYDSTSARTIGLVKDAIAAGDTGWVVTQGQASKLQLGAYSEGDVLYLDSIDGGLTKTKPVAPYHGVFVCIVERANNGNGLAYVKPLNGQELGEIHDVRITSPINNQILVYSDTQDIWKNRSAYSVIDTTQLSARIDQRVNYSDTASMLNPYLRSSTASATYLAKSDSTIYQTKYRSDTARTNTYNAINAKPTINGTGFVKASGTTISYDNSTYITNDGIFTAYQLLGSSVKGTALGAYTLDRIISTISLSDGAIRWCAVYLPNAATITGVKYFHGTTGNYTGDNYNGIALFSKDGDTLRQIGLTKNYPNLWKPTQNTWQSQPFDSSCSCTLSAGVYYVAANYNVSGSTTNPTLGVSASVGAAAINSFDFTNSAKISGTTSPSQNSIPTKIALSGITGATQTIPFYLY